MTSGFSFGTPGTGAAASTGFSFGTQPAASGASATGFGAATTKPIGFAFGTPAASVAATTKPNTGFSFGTTTTASAPNTAFGFGTPGAPSVGTTGLGFGTTPGATAGLLGVKTPATNATTGFSFSSTPAVTTTSSGLFSLGGFRTSTTAASGTTGFSFSNTPAAGIAGTGFPLGKTSTGLLSGGFNINAAKTTSSLTLGPVFTSTAATPVNKGLGGLPPVSSSSLGNGNTTGKPSDSKAIKETGVPNEIVQTIENFKKHVKDQKVVREDITRMSSKPIFRVQEEIQTLRQLLSVVSNGLQRNAGVIQKLKTDTAYEMKNVEIAQRTKDTPPGLQYENTLPAEYFQNLVEDFEVRMQQYRHQIDVVESHFATLSQPAFISPQDLTNLLRKLHETFLALAAQLHGIHEAVKTQKEQYLNYRKVFHGDTQNVFETRRKIAETMGQRTINLAGPSAFAGISHTTASAMASAINIGQQPQGGAPPPTLGLNATMLSQPTSQLGGFSGFNTSSGTGLGLSFGVPSAASTPAPGFGFAASNAFQLQKPPSGTKRGKKN